MSHQTTSTNSPQSIKKTRKKYDKTKLPTPPPDPIEGKKSETFTESDFLEYLETLQQHHASISNSTSAIASAMLAEDAFDHLERLYKLMEQMLELRVQNVQLHRKIRDLEYAHNLQKMHKQLETLPIDDPCHELFKDTGFAETILESILSDTKTTSPVTKSKTAPNILRQSLLRKQRNRSISITDKPSESSRDETPRRASTTAAPSLSKGSKISKWTKVKAAFKWEKASSTVGDAKSSDSGINCMLPSNVEVARYLRVPSTSDDAGHSPTDSGAAEVYTPGSLSTASSNEDFHKHGRRSPCEDFRSSDDDHCHKYESHSKEFSNISPRSSQKTHRTPWAKVKDIIHTRGSFKKKTRLSNQSDEIQIDVEPCSDNENVFEDPIPAVDNQQSLRFRERNNNNEISPDIITRYQEAVSHDSLSSSSEPRKISRWTRVKKAFLPSSDGDSSQNDPKDTDLDAIKVTQKEINQNYRQLQEKLSLEFHDKITEWHKLKQSSPGTSNASSACGFTDDTKDAVLAKKIDEWNKIKAQTDHSPKIPLTKEEDLPPEFKKKLQEWEKIKKVNRESCRKKPPEPPRFKTRSTSKCEQSNQPDYPIISEDFRKKMEEWKQIKARTSIGPNVETDCKKKKDKTPSPNLSRKSSNKSKKLEKELQWLEKELHKIEKEKQRLEVEKQKFLEKEERLNMLRNSVTGSEKKEILVHTPSGYYKFGGISKKFTRKLYEWEKSRGIAPESSTIALLSSQATPEIKVTSARQDFAERAVLSRSKSAESFAAINSSNYQLISQPSSLSLNDVEHLEKECVIDSKCSSGQFMDSHFAESDYDEPEALIVEIEDFVEETAAPLRSFAKEHNPVYQREEIKELCESGTCLAPKIRRSESTRAQNSYMLIEDILSCLRKISEVEAEIKQYENSLNPVSPTKLKAIYEQQQHLAHKLSQNINRLHEENSSVILNITREKEDSLSQISDALETVQDISLESIILSGQLDNEINNRYKIIQGLTTSSTINVAEIISELRTKILDLRRNLSYVCAASDLTNPAKNLEDLKCKIAVSKSLSNESKESRCDTSDVSRDSEKTSHHYIKSGNSNNGYGQGAVKKRIRYKQKSMQSRSIQDSDDDENVANEQRKKHRKLTRTRSTSESGVVPFDFSIQRTPEKLDVRRTVSSGGSVLSGNSEDSATDSPVTIFVKTTRKVFAPFVESHTIDKPQNETIENLAESANLRFKSENIPTIEFSDLTKDLEEKIETDLSSQLPPSPLPQRKLLKDMSPSIRIMLAKYNQKLSEQEAPSAKSAASSGSQSPVAWRSPTLERRVKTQTEKYLNAISKKEVKKSASTHFIPFKSEEKSNNQDENLDVTNNITKSCSATAITSNSRDEDQIKNSFLETNELKLSNVKQSTFYKTFQTTLNDLTRIRLSPNLRSKKLQKAKEDFLNSPPYPICNSTGVSSQELNYPCRNRLSQVSVDSSVDSSSVTSSICSPGLLIKSASAGMINIDPNAYRQFDPEVHGNGYVSLPRNTKSKEGKSTFSSIASKFRKVRMRKGKEKEKFSAVSVLCRQSLVVDITNSNEQSTSNNASGVVSEFINDSEMRRSESWVKKTKLFRT